MSAQNAEVKCAKCKVALQGPSAPKPQDRFSCPKCGVWDSYENVMREVGEQAQEQLAARLAHSMRAATRGNKYVKVTEKPRAKRSHRFIVDLRL
jgi:hypothetical protein